MAGAKIVERRRMKDLREKVGTKACIVGKIVKGGGGCWSRNCYAHFSTHSFHCTFIMINMKKYREKKIARGSFPWKWRPYSILGH